MNKYLKTMTNLEKFYDWMLKVQNVHMANLQSMDRAFNIIIENDERIRTKRTIYKQSNG
jgi:hypothetical protein